MDMVKMMKQAASLQKEMKKQKLSRMKMTHEGGSVRIDISGEPVLQVSIDPSLIQSGDVKRIEKTIETALQGAVGMAQAKVGEQIFNRGHGAARYCSYFRDRGA